MTHTTSRPTKRIAMKYWGYCAAKVVTAAALMTPLGMLLRRLFPHRDPASFPDLQQRMWHDMGSAIGLHGFWLLCAGLVYLIVVDQKFRCRTCLRRLRMPITRGSWGHFLTGRPHLEYICPYGHGTLKVPELHITGKEPNAWAEHQDIWTELELLETEKR